MRTSVLTQFGRLVRKYPPVSMRFFFLPELEHGQRHSADDLHLVVGDGTAAIDWLQSWKKTH